MSIPSSDPKTMRLGEIVYELSQYAARDVLRRNGTIPNSRRSMEEVGRKGEMSRRFALYDELDRRERQYRE